MSSFTNDSESSLPPVMVEFKNENEYFVGEEGALAKAELLQQGREKGFSIIMGDWFLTHDLGSQNRLMYQHRSELYI